MYAVERDEPLALLEPPAAPHRLPQPMRLAPPPMPAPTQDFATAVMDEMDYPLFTVGRGLRLSLANRAAQRLLDADTGALRQQAGRLTAADPQAQPALDRAVDAALLRGLRTLVSLQPSLPAGLTVAVVPVPPSGPAQAPAALLIMAKARLCEDLTLDGFARDRGLTPGEARVMRALCEGQAPEYIARQHGVALSTVRTQISALRAKTGAKNVRALTRLLATLPPLVSTLRVRQRS